MIVSVFITLFLLVAVGAFVRSGFEHRSLTARQNVAYKRPFNSYVPEADNL